MKLTLALIATLILISAGCASSGIHNGGGAPSGPIAHIAAAVHEQGLGLPLSADLGSDILAQITQQVTAFVEKLRADSQAAYDAAAVGGDLVGAQCHAFSLTLPPKLLAVIPQPVHITVSGPASLAEDVRLKRMSLQKSQTAFDELKPLLTEWQDKCAAVYPVMTFFRPVADVLRVVIP